MRLQTRIVICRWGFVLLCVLPTLLVGGWIGLRSMIGFGAASKVEWERELTLRLGLIAEIGEVRYSQPGVARLMGFKLLAPETREVLAEARQLEVVATTDGWQIEATQLAIEQSQLGLIARTIDQRVLRGPLAFRAGQQAFSFRFVPSDIFVRAAGKEQCFERLGGECRLGSTDCRLELSFDTAGAGGRSAPVRVVASRSRGQSLATTQWQLDTGGSAVPCSLAAGLMPQLFHLGRECDFAGIFDLVDSPDGVSGQIAGKLTHVDLDSLITEQFPHQLSGQATVQIEQGRFEGGKLAEMRGTIQASNGAISRSLVAAAAQHLGLSAGDPVDGSSSAVPIPVRRLAIGFQIKGSSLVLRGSADPTSEGALLANAAGPILTAPPRHSAASIGLLRTLLPDNEYQVPATRQTGALVRLFPVPEATGTKAVRLPAHTPTRLTPAATEPTQTAIRPPVLR